MGCTTVQVVHQCYRSYLRAYKIDIGSSGKLPPIGVYSKAVGNTEHVDSLCRQYDSLHNCIQSNDVQTSTLECMNLKMFEALTLRYEDAIHYMINYAAYEFACSEGYKANEQCFKVTLTSKTVEKELLRCKLILIQDDPIGTCHSYKKDAHCTSEVFGEACGRVVGRAMCELMVHLGHYLAGVERSCLHVLNAECSRYSSAAHSTTCLISVQILFILMTILWQFQTIGV
ncbi:unnamed protein product [Anisakis simplex]|uniref:DUF19 domain-containing protein n=1 Tax=Anisakis simplex TaxID=6269 RepID=A0A0M3JXL3_ANISI|nr:unnamed protein product [Anisakis simplex]